jgi:hypothetical protein
VFCNKCGQRIADDSRFCKFCRATQETPEASPSAVAESTSLAKRKDNSAKIIFGVVGAILLLIIMASLSNPSATGSGSASDRDTAGTSNTGEGSDASSQAAASNWSYSTETDKVRGSHTYYASTTSTNTVHQDFPYSSTTTMDILLRKSAAYGTDVILRISSGQMMCPSYEGCSGNVRFDDGSAERIRFRGPADNSSDVVFVDGAKAFIGKLRKAKRVVVEKTLFQAGAPQFEFNVQGLKWDH